MLYITIQIYVIIHCVIYYVGDFMYYYSNHLLIYLSPLQRDNSLIGMLLFVLNPCCFAPVRCM